MHGIADGEGKAYFEEGCVAPEAKDLQPEVYGLNSCLDEDEAPYRVVALYVHPAQLSAELSTKVVEALEMLENGALNVAANAKNRGDDYDVGYAQAMAKMARDTLTVLSAPAHPAEGVPAHELIDWDSAHKIAFQAAAAFRPSYFKGAGFIAHNWVVEAIRSAHIDGQRHAMGLTAIDRSAAFAAELRKERAATQPAAQGMDAEDAARYHWLREQHDKGDDSVTIFIGDEQHGPGHLDAQIDEAIAAQAKQEGV